MLLNQIIDQAIQAALVQDWQTAIERNLEVLDNNPYHIASLNRLAKAYTEIGDINKASETYAQVLEIDPYNPIAKKNLLQLEHIDDGCNSRVICTDFIEEPGLTKTIPLVRLGDAKLLNSLLPGQIACLQCNSHLVCVTTTENEHIGALTDDMAYFLRGFIQAGNTYQVVIKSSTPKSVQIYLREISRAPDRKDLPSFANY